MVQTARLLHAIPEARAAAHAGLLGCRPVAVVGQGVRQPALRRTIPRLGGVVGRSCASVVVRRVRGRGASVGDASLMPTAPTTLMNGPTTIVMLMSASSGRRVYVDARGGVLAGAVIEEIFERFCRCRVPHRLGNRQRQMGRTDEPATVGSHRAQRRFDALLAMFTAAAGSGVVGRFDPLVNIIVDQTTFEHHLAACSAPIVEPIDPATVDQRRCETSRRGHQIDPPTCSPPPSPAMSVGSCSTPPEWSSTSAAGHDCSPVAPVTRCCWVIDGVCGPDAIFAPGAAKPTTPNPGPPTVRPARTTAGPACARHNRWKQHGYRTWRDPPATGTPTAPTAPKSAAFRTTNVARLRPIRQRVFRRTERWRCSNRTGLVYSCRDHSTIAQAPPARLRGDRCY